jgi:hypothetical protein
MTPNTTIKSLDKIKLLDQMLEDLAGDEFEEYNEAETDIESELMRHATNDN